MIADIEMTEIAGHVGKDPVAVAAGSLSVLDEIAFDRFYRKVSAGLWSYLHRVTGNAAVADDLFQKTFFRFLRRGAQVPTEETHLRRYLYRIASNLITDHWRESSRERGHVELDPAMAVQSATDSEDAGRDMMRVFHRMKPQERALLWLAHVEGSSHSEIAEALGVSEKSVRVLLFRARARLLVLLDEKGIGPEVVR